MPRGTLLLVRLVVLIAAAIGLVLLQGCGTDDEVVISPKAEGGWNSKPAQEEENNEPQRYAWTVTMGDLFFGPPDAAVEPASTVTWINLGSEPHTVTADDGSFDSGALNPGDSFAAAFEGEGTVTYHCAIHPFMTGSVTVSDAAY